jgi:CBS domain containing-hemolysin-like protein
VTLLLLYVGLALGVSFVCSVLEAALLSARLGSLIERRDAGNRGAEVLLEIKRKRTDDAISAILTLNTIAHTIGAALAGAQAADVFGDAWVGVFSGVLTLLVLVVTEIIPKTLGTVHADRLAGVVGRTLALLIRVMAPLLVVTRALTRLVARHKERRVSRGELAALVAIASQQGSIGPETTQIFSGALRLEEILVEDVMTPRTVATMLPTDATLKDLIDHTEAQAFSRVPLFEGNRDRVVGYVLQREALRDAARGADLTQPLKERMRPVWYVPENVSIGRALQQFLQRHEHLAMVGDEHGGTSGLVTFEDLVESILGAEILDETDEVADLRNVAAQLRDQRLERVRSTRLPGADD